VPSREVSGPRTDRQSPSRIDEIRQEIGSRIEQHNLPAAAGLYLELIQLDPQQVLPRQHLLDIANQLASDHHAAEAVQAYEQFLAHYSTTYEYPEQVELMLGILYSRYLHNPEEAIKHLRNAAPKLVNPGQVQMCRDELARLGA
jgi:outer membrane protein assembly factor BamD (BamD/ComL family)